MPWITYESSDSLSSALYKSQSLVRALYDTLRLIADQDQAVGGRVTEAEAWRNAQKIARDTIKGSITAHGPLQEEIHVLTEELRERDAMLCAILSSIYFLDGYAAASCKVNDISMPFSAAVEEWFDWEESGVSWEHLQAWWTAHQEQDCVRREQEALEVARKREAALAKLTPEEREILGL